VLALTTADPQEALETEVETRTRLMEQWAALFNYEGYPETDGLLAIVFATALENRISLSSMNLGDDDVEAGEDLEYQTQTLILNLEAESHSDIFTFLSGLHRKVPAVRVERIDLGGFGDVPSAKVGLIFLIAPAPPSEEEAPSEE